MTKANQEEMLARIQEKMDANTKVDQEQMLAKMEANTKAMREDIKCGQGEMRSLVGSIEEKMDAWISNIKDDRNKRTSYQEAMEAHLECEEPT
jgi:aconitase B